MGHTAATGGPKLPLAAVGGEAEPEEGAAAAAHPNDGTSGIGGGGAARESVCFGVRPDRVGAVPFVASSCALSALRVPVLEPGGRPRGTVAGNVHSRPRRTQRPQAGMARSHSTRDSRQPEGTQSHGRGGHSSTAEHACGWERERSGGIIETNSGNEGEGVDGTQEPAAV